MSPPEIQTNLGLSNTGPTTSNTPTVLKTTQCDIDLETKNELMQKNAIEENKAKEHPTPELLVVPEGIKNGILGWLSSFFDSSKNKLPKQNIT